MRIAPIIALSLIATTAPAGAELRSYTERVPGTEIRFEMIAVPAGEFRMGSPATERGRKDDEGPQVSVRMEPFCIGKFEVSWPEYQEFAKGYQHVQMLGARKPVIDLRDLSDAVTYPTPIYDMELGPVLQRMGRGTGKPAVAMSQLAARQFTKWLSKKTGNFYRLPTEAEWEYACRAGTTTAYSSGNDRSSLEASGWYVDNSRLSDGDTGYHAAGQKKPNAWGIHDMHGNVGEWCFDAYDAAWYARFAGKTVAWHDVINWPLRRYPGVIRGGGYDSEADSCRSAARFQATRQLNQTDPDVPRSPYWESDAHWVGFRVVCPLKVPDMKQRVRFWDPAPEDTATNENIRRDRDAHEIIPPSPMN